MSSQDTGRAGAGASGTVYSSGTPAQPQSSGGSVTPPAEIPPSGVAPSTDRTTTARGSEEVIPLSEEQLEVGKRTVDRGTTRIRRYVVEKPE